MEKILFFMFSAKAKHIKAMVIWTFALLVAPGFSYSQPTKTLDFRSDVNYTQQQYPYWCVYACWEARTGGSQDQCEGCNYYIKTYIVPYYNSNQNPYHQLVDTIVFNPTMADYVADITSPCDNGSEYSYFGVLSNTLSSYFNEEVYSGTFIGGITDPDLDYLTGPFFAVSTDPANGTGHCVLFVGSDVYNDDPNDPESKIYVMDPLTGNEDAMSLQDFADDYTQYFK